VSRVKIAALIAGLALMQAATPAAAAQWSVDTAKSRLGFTVQWSKEPFSGTFKSWKADIGFDPAELSRAHASVTVDLASEESDEPDFDDGLKGALGFQVSQYPVARFVTSGFTHKAGNDYIATGHLSIRGVTRDVILPFSLTIEGGQAHMKGTAQIVRTDFGVGSGMWSAASPVAHEVTVTIDLFATRM
jgi:polyisoprenoid-binding protein YceI